VVDQAALRIDKWLWHARFFKTRGLATQVVGAGNLRLNGERVRKPSTLVRPGDTLTFIQAGHVRVVRVLGLQDRRGSATEARLLYEDLTVQVPKEPPDATRE
jgi:ribosome-associated heat shock protein Hsp15